LCQRQLTVCKDGPVVWDTILVLLANREGNTSDNTAEGTGRSKEGKESMGSNTEGSPGGSNLVGSTVVDREEGNVVLNMAADIEEEPWEAR